VQAAVAAKNQARDQAFDAAVEEAELQIPQVSEKSNKALIYGGVGLGALALIYLMTRKG